MVQSTNKSNISHPENASASAQLALECLSEAVADEFARKYRLGYSAVTWKDGECYDISGDDLLTAISAQHDRIG